MMTSFMMFLTVQREYQEGKRTRQEYQSQKSCNEYSYIVTNAVNDVTEYNLTVSESVEKSDLTTATLEDQLY